MEPVIDRETPEDRAPDAVLVRDVESILARGGLVALPTETVYGIAARADVGAALDALRKLKGRPAEMGLTWHVGSRDALDRFPMVSPMARRLVARYWPGPLTLVLPGVPERLDAVAHRGWTGVRMPAHPLTSGILSALEFPVVLSSANRHGEPPACTAADVERIFSGAVARVIDGGPARLSEASCVLRLGPKHFDLLREGLFTREQLRAVAGLRIGFVCTGNTCRSPMAEGFAKKVIAERLAVAPARIGHFGFEVRSMGVFARPGEPASKNAVVVMRDVGVNLAKHASRAALAEDVQSYDRIYCMTRNHLEALAVSLPPGRDKNLEMLDPSGKDISDPMGGDRAQYRRAAEQIMACIQQRSSDWA
jgi:tRNA threonylcarbamoyl adenosine modification protein (Sua5/YciO/YrdC/YwlC family)